MAAAVKARHGSAGKVEAEQTESALQFAEKL
jgi:hypothetical protein